MQLSRVIFGAMGLPTKPLAQATRLIHCAVDHGITSFDTAPLYGAGESERILGKALKDRRSGVQLLTKCGVRWDGQHGQPMFDMVVDGKLATVRKDSRIASIRDGLEASLRNLATDVIDLFQIHHFDDRTPIEDTMGELERALDAGKIRAIGVSNYPARELHRANSALRGRLFSTQSALSLLDMRAMTELLPRTLAEGIAFLAYEPLARGRLAGKPPKEPGEAPPGSAGVTSALQAEVLPIAEAQGATVAQIALAWLLAQPGVTAVVVGASSEQQAIDNASAPRLRLERESIERLTEAFSQCQIDGDSRGALASRLRRRARRLKHAVEGSLKKWLSR